MYETLVKPDAGQVLGVFWLLTDHDDMKVT